MTIDPAFLDELEQFEASLKRETTARRQGEQESPQIGEGLTFSDYRRYTPGDDFRLIDWKVFARTDELFIKQFEAERNLTVHVLLDASESMDFGADDARKFDYGAKLGLGFCYLTAEENNDFRFSTFREEHDRLDTDRSTRGEVLQLIDVLNVTDPSGVDDFAAACEDYASTIHSRSLVLIVSDCLHEPDVIEEGLASLARNDVILARTLAPTERNPDASGDTIFEDPETASQLRTYFGGSMERRYHTRLQNHVEEVSDRCEDLRVDHAVVDTGADFFDSFASVWVG